VVLLDQRTALRIGALGATTGVSDIVDVSVAICARDRGHAIITTDAADLRAIDPHCPC
jgi:hypothetical protein